MRPRLPLVPRPKEPSDQTSSRRGGCRPGGRRALAHAEPAPPPSGHPGRPRDAPPTPGAIRLGGPTVYEFRQRAPASASSSAPKGCRSAPRWVGSASRSNGAAREAGWILRKLHEQRERSGACRFRSIERRDRRSRCLPGRDGDPGARPARAPGAVLNTRPSLARRAPDAARGPTADTPPAQIRDAGAKLAAAPGPARLRRALPHFAHGWACASGAVAQFGHHPLGQRQRRRVDPELAAARFALPVIDYVVTHELAHLREMNHSATFWDVVARCCLTWRGPAPCAATPASLTGPSPT